MVSLYLFLISFLFHLLLSLLLLIDRDIDISNDSICNHHDDVQSECDDTFAALIVVNPTIREYDALESIEEDEDDK